MRTTLKTILLTTGLMCGLSSFAQTETPATIHLVEILTVEFFGTNNTCVISKPSGEVETISIGKGRKDADRSRGEKDQTFRALFQRLYDEGWAIESEVGPDGNYKVLYILKRELK